MKIPKITMNSGVFIFETIDNDLLENDHTLWYGSAARFVAVAMGDNFDNISLPGVKIMLLWEGMRFSGSSFIFGAVNEGDGPHLILPERPFVRMF